MIQESKKHFYGGYFLYKTMDGKRHREDGPAFRDDDGFEVYWINDNRHRENGPGAYGPQNTEKKFYIDGVWIC